jgi:hypothetical protein
MELSTIIIGLSVMLLVASLIAYSILTTTRPNLSNAMSPKVGSLNTPTNVGSIADVRDSFLAPPGATFSVYIFLAASNKTPSIGRTQEPVIIFQMGNVMKLQILPGGVSSPPRTVLLIQTQGNKEIFEELPLSNLPEQKWVQVVVVREGRRFTVFYNGKAVGSLRMINYPVINSAQLKIGDTRLKGEFVRPIISPTPMRIEEIQNDLKDSSNTREEPYKPMDFAGVLAKFGCPGGMFCFSTSQPPTSNPLKMWQSQYA